MPLSRKSRAHSRSFSIGISVWLASLFRLCHAPSFMVVKSLSQLKDKPLSACMHHAYLSWVGFLVESIVELASGILYHLL